MKNLFIVIIMAMGVFFFLGIIFQLLQHRKKPAARYTCLTCGKHDCVCQKE